MERSNGGGDAGLKWAWLSAASYAASNLLLKLGSARTEPALAAAIMLTPAWLLSTGLALQEGRSRARWQGVRAAASLWVPMMTGGLLAYFVGNQAFIRSLQVGGAAVAVPSAQSSVLWAALLGALFLGEGLSRRQVLGVLSFGAGLVGLGWGLGAAAAATPRAGWWMALPLGLLAGLCWSLASLFMRWGMRRGLSHYQALSLATGGGWLGLVTYVTVTYGPWGWIGLAGGGALNRLAGAALLNALAQLSLAKALSLSTVARVSATNSASVAAVVVLSWLLLGERVTPVGALGVAALLAGVRLVQTGRRQSGGPAVAEGN